MNYLQGREILQERRKNFVSNGYASKYFDDVLVAAIDDNNWYLMINGEIVKGEDINEVELMFKDLRKTAASKAKLGNKAYCIWTYDTYSLYWRFKEFFDNHGFTVFEYNDSHFILALENDHFIIKDIQIRTGKTKKEFIGDCGPEDELNIYYSWVCNELTEIPKQNNPAYIPTTSTNALKNEFDRKCKNGIDGLKSYKLNCYGFYKGTWKDLDWTKPEVVDVFSDAFKGGFMTMNYKYYNKTVKNAAIYDRCSAYPAIIATEKLPYLFRHWEDKDSFISHTFGDKRATLGVYKFKNLELKPNCAPYISENWGEGRGIIKSDIFPRIISAVEFKITAYDLTFIDIYNYYTFDKVEILDMYVSDCYVNVKEDVVNVILDNFVKKTELKGVKGKEFEYNRSKEHLNAGFGIMGERLKRGDVYKNPCSIGSKQLFYYPWGGYVAAIQRHLMADLAIKLGKDFIYSNTDSFAVINTPEAKEVMDNWNKEYAAKLEKIGNSKTTARTKNNTLSTIGLFELETVTDDFRFIGINRYCYHKGNEFVIKFSGVEKISEKLTSLGKFSESVYRIFDIYTEGGTVEIYDGLVSYHQGKKIYRPLLFNKYTSNLIL